MTPKPFLIIVDWGTTNFRAYLIDELGAVIDKVASNDGVLRAQDRFEEILTNHLCHWINTEISIPVLLSGMVGSKKGWVEVPYVPCPLNVETLASKMYQIQSYNQGQCWIVPGASCFAPSESFDVMRGEEIQFFGAKYAIENQSLIQPDIICLPGTHNKWIESSGDNIIRFSTAMTGEAFKMFSQDSILAQSISPDAGWDQDAFVKGLDSSSKAGGLLHLLFTVRSLNLSGEHSLNQGLSYLSGLIIGFEISCMLSEKKIVAVVSSQPLLDRYVFALKHMGFEAYGIDSDQANILGALKIAELIHTNRVNS